MQNLDISNMKAAIFDMDGTMVDNSAYHKRAFKEFLKRHGISLTDEELKKKISGRKNDDIFPALFNQQLSKEEIAKYAHEKEAIYRELYASDIKEVEGLKTIVDSLKKDGLKLAIATTAPKENRDFALESLGLTNAFQVIVGDEHVTRGKPHPEVYLKTAEKLGIDPGKCLAFEDTPSGVESAKRAGMTVIGLMTSHTTQELYKADIVVNNFSELLVSS